MSESWDDYANGWDSNASVIAYAEKAYQSLIDRIEIENCRALDFGCGTGLLSSKLAEQAGTVVSIDPSEKMIDVLNEKCIENVSTITSELNQDLIDGHELLTPKFDLIVASSVLAFVPDYPDTVRLLKQLMREGAYFVQWDWVKGDDEGIGFTEDEIKLVLNGVGLDDMLHIDSILFGN